MHESGTWEQSWLKIEIWELWAHLWYLKSWDRLLRKSVWSAREEWKSWAQNTPVFTGGGGGVGSKGVWWEQTAFSGDGRKPKVAISQAPSKKMFQEGWSDQSCHSVLRFYDEDWVGIVGSARLGVCQSLWPLQFHCSGGNMFTEMSSKQNRRWGRMKVIDN